MTIFGFIILIIIILISGYYIIRKEGFEVWPVPNPDELGNPTAPAIMKFDERVAKGEIVPTPAISEPRSRILQVETADPYGSGAAYSLGGLYGPGGIYGGLYGPSSMYGGIYGGMYGPGGVYGQYPFGYNPLSFGGGGSGSSSIGGFGPAAPRGLVTPAQAQLAAAAAPSAATPSAATPSAATPMLTPSVAPKVSVGGGGSRAKALSDEVDTKSYDWSGLAAQSAMAYEPTQTYEAPPPIRAAEPLSPFETVTAASVLKRTSITPNITASTAISLPTAMALPDAPTGPLSRAQSVDLVNQQRFAQAMFGSIQMPGISTALGTPTAGPGGIITPPAGIAGLKENTSYIPVNEAPIYSAVGQAAAVRGSSNQPGSAFGDSRTTQTVIDAGPGQLATSRPLVGVGGMPSSTVGA